MSKVEFSASAIERLRQLPAALSTHEGFADVVSAMREGGAAAIGRRPWDTG